MNIEEIKNEVKKHMSEERYYHSLCVMERCIELARIYNVDEEKAKLAGITHDIAKELPNEEKIEYAEKNGLEIDNVERISPGLLHGKIGADMCKKRFGFEDDILDAIQYHTTGKEDMSMLTKIVFIADSTGKDREYDSVERVRRLSEENIDEAIIFNLEHIIKETIDKKRYLHLETVKARNYLIKTL